MPAAAAARMRGELDHRAAARIETGAIALLVERAEGDAEQARSAPAAGWPQSVPCSDIFCQTTSVTPVESQRETYPCCAETPLAEHAPGGTVAVSSGWMPTISATTPADMPLMDRAEHAAEIAGLDQNAGDGDMQCIARRGGPGRARKQDERQHEGEHAGEAQQQEGQRFGVGQAELGADESRCSTAGRRAPAHANAAPVPGRAVMQRRVKRACARVPADSACGCGSTSA